MYRVGQKEIDEVAKVLLSGKVFRYHIGDRCARFEARYAKHLGIKDVRLTASGTYALTAALIGLRIGPGMEVLVPAHTYMATAIAVLAAGAIPVIVDVDESLTLDPDALEDAIGPRTRAVIPVHMWGLPCDMKRIMRVARRRKLLVIEDACQSVGGGYEGKMLGSIGHAGAFSFNYYKNMTAGEGGAVASNSARVIRRADCSIDCCRFYWDGRDRYLEPFIFCGARASEIQGAILNAQLDRLPGMIRAMRSQKKRILKATAKTGLTPVRANSLDYECGTHVGYILPGRTSAASFAKQTGGMIAGKTGRHVYTEWDPIFARQGAHHPALDPFRLRENKRCRRTYRKDMCKRSLNILDRAVLIRTHPDFKSAHVAGIIKKVKSAASNCV